MTYRYKKLLAYAKESPHCMFCGAENHGQIVAAHSNQQKHGHGTGHKSADCLTAYVCGDCHDIIDGRSKAKEHDRQSRIEMHADAFYKTVLWLFETGRIKT